MRAARRCPDGIAERTLAFAAPHDAVNRIAAYVVLGEGQPESLQSRIMEARCCRLFARKRYFQQWLQALEIAPERVFIPAEGLHAVRLRLGNNRGNNIEITIVWRLNFFERGTRVVLLVGAGEVAAMVVGVIFLLAVIGEWLSRNLPSGDAASITVGGEKQRIDSNFVLEAVEHLRNTFVYKRDRAHLDADHSAAARRCLREIRLYFRAFDLRAICQGLRPTR